MTSRILLGLLALLLPPWFAPAAAAASAPPPLQRDDERESPKERERRLEAEAKAVARTLREALASKEISERRTALTVAAETDHAVVVKAMAEALGDRDVGVRRITLQLLGRMSDGAAVAVLKNHARKERKALQEDPETMEELLRAVGRHADPKTAKWLAKGAFEEEARVRRARVFAAARARSSESLEAIFAGMKKVEERRLRMRFGEARIALVWLTGKDLGANPSAWLKWWTENARSFEVPAEEPRLSAEMENAWRRFWGEGRTYERQRKRGDRG